MQLIRKTRREKNKNGHWIYYAIFLCPKPNCNKEVEKPITQGLRAKSCGCQEYSEERNKKISDALKGRKLTEEHRQNVAKGCKGRVVTEEARQKMREKAKGRKSPLKGKKLSEEHINKIKLANKGKKRTDVQKEKYAKAKKGKKFTKEHIVNLSKSHKGIQIGEKNPQWQGGKTFEIYPQEFNKDLKQSILERDNYTCQDPNCKGKHIKLHIHHIDYDKQNNNPNNLITLCISCHPKTTVKNKREYYTEFYQTMMINRIIDCLI